MSVFVVSVLIHGDGVLGCLVGQVEDRLIFIVTMRVFSRCEFLGRIKVPRVAYNPPKVPPPLL